MVVRGGVGGHSALIECREGVDMTRGLGKGRLNTLATTGIVSASV